MAIANKKDALQNLVDIFNTYNDNEQEDFSRLCSRLLNENFIYSQIDTDKNDYYKISSMKETISNYFSLMDYSLYHDDQFKIFYLVTETGRNAVKFKKLDTIILLILRLFYYQKSKDNINIIVTVGELYAQIMKTSIYGQDIKKTNLVDSLTILRKYKIIYFKGSDLISDTQFIIYPTIIHAVSFSNIQDLENKILSYRKMEDNEDENN